MQVSSRAAVAPARSTAPDTSSGRSAPAASGAGRRRVEEKAPAPARVAEEAPADEGADDRRDGEGRRDVALVAPALARGDEVADGGHRQGHEAARGGALNGAQGDELRDVLGRAAQRRGGDEDEQRDLEEQLAA